MNSFPYWELRLFHIAEIIDGRSARLFSCEKNRATYMRECSIFVKKVGIWLVLPCTGVNYAKNYAK